MHVVRRHCLRPTLSLNFPQATATAHILCGYQWAELLPLVCNCLLSAYAFRQHYPRSTQQIVSSPCSIHLLIVLYLAVKKLKQDA
jgi:hypothetical protein